MFSYVCTYCTTNVKMPICMYVTSIMFVIAVKSLPFPFCVGPYDNSITNIKAASNYQQNNPSNNNCNNSKDLKTHKIDYNCNNKNDHINELLYMFYIHSRSLLIRIGLVFLVKAL